MPIEKSQTNLTAYPQTESAVQKSLSQASIDVESFKQLLKPCSLSSCRGMCCYDGVYIGKESAEVIQKLADEDAPFFRAIGLNLPEQVIVDGEWKGEIYGKKTEVKEKNFSGIVKNYPTHFNNTACVFLLDDGRCGLQVISEYKGLHPWYYKPFTCWMHPLAISYEEEFNCLLLHTDESDPCRFPDYDGFVTKTFCGKIRICGQPAHNVLEEELRFLGKIVGRDFVEEIKDYFAKY